MRIALRFIFSFLLISSLCLSDTINVPSDQPTIQAGIDAAVNGDIVLVAPGTYVENINFMGKKIVVTSSSGPEKTIIDGNQKGSVVVFNHAETPDTVLDGFTILNGTGTVGLTSEKTGGGGIYCLEASPTITRNIICRNTLSNGSGGGIIVMDGGPIIMYNTIHDNIGTPIGGIADWSDEFSSTISYNRIYNNSGASCGGIRVAGNSVYEGNLSHDNTECGIYVLSSYEPILRYNVIYRNHNSNDRGGGIVCWHTDITIEGNIIFFNKANQGGGMYGVDSQIQFINNTVVYNQATVTNGGGLFLLNCDIDVINSIFWGNNGSTGDDQIFHHAYTNINVSFSDVEDGWPGMGNISEDPLFVDIRALDFHIPYNSPCKDSGRSDVPGIAGLDFEGDPRVVDLHVDMGADEFHTHLYCTGIPTPDGYVHVKLIGQPGATPAMIWCGSGVLGDPIPTQYGEWFLELPAWLEIDLVDIPANGVRIFPQRLEPRFPSPTTLPMQALIGWELSNLFVLEVR